MTADTISLPQSNPSVDVADLSLSKYRERSFWRSIWQVGSTVAVFVALWVLCWWSLDVSYLLTLAVALPTAGCLVRLFILAHDCGHGSLFASKTANTVVGSCLGMLSFTPYHRWRKIHAIHHATSGDLDRRGGGDVHMLTVREYNACSRWKRLAYRIQRHPLILFGIGPFLYFVFWQRLVLEPPAWKQERRSVHLTNLALAVIVFAMCWVFGTVPFLLVHVPVLAVASSAGVWLFYVQHHYETTYWQRHEHWKYADASLQGSSYYKLPKILQWFTANIGLHHIHHLDSQIPNYRLQACFDENPPLQHVNQLTIRESIACAALRLWDEDEQKMVPIR